MYLHIQELQSAGFNKLIEKELSRLYKQAIDCMSPRKKEIFILSREEELSYEEIAQKLGISVNTVRNQMAYALNSIREFFSQHPDLARIFIASMFIQNIF